MPSEQELRWAEALQIEKMHGADALRWVADRLRTLALAGDIAGVERFKQIAARLAQLVDTGQGHA